MTTAELKNFTSKPNPPAATLVNLGAVTVTGRAHAGMGNTTAKSVDFSYSDIQSQVKKTVTTTNFTSSLTSSLLGDLSLSVNVARLDFPFPGSVRQSAASLAAQPVRSINCWPRCLRRSVWESDRPTCGYLESAATERCW